MDLSIIGIYNINRSLGNIGEVLLYLFLNHGDEISNYDIFKNVSSVPASQVRNGNLL